MHRKRFPTRKAKTLILASALTVVSTILCLEISKSLSLSTYDWQWPPPPSFSDNAPPCNAYAFREYYERSFFSDGAASTEGRRVERGGVPFHSECLKRLIDADPHDLRLRIAHVRRRYVERMAVNGTAGVGDGDGEGDGGRGRRRHLFYLCRARKTCGGLGDRLRGMGRTFYLALATDAQYGAVVEGGARFDAYLAPTGGRGGDLDFLGGFLDRVGWLDEYESDPRFEISGWFAMDSPAARAKRRPTARLLLGEYAVSNRNEMSGFYNHRGTNLTRTMDWEAALFPPLSTGNDDDNNNVVASVTFVETNLLLGDLTKNPRLSERLIVDYRLGGLTNAELYHVFLSLYASEPTEELGRAAGTLGGVESEAVRPYSSSPLKRIYTIGMQVRLGSHEGSEGAPWKTDDARHPMASVPCMARKALDLCDSAKKEGGREMEVECRIFVTTDSPRAAEWIESEIDGAAHVIRSDWPAVHVDNVDREVDIDPSGAFETNLGVFVEWYLLASRSDAFVLSRSGFSYMASIFRSDGVSVDYRPAVRLLCEGELLPPGGKKVRGGENPGDDDARCVFREWNRTTFDEDYFSREYL